MERMFETGQRQAWQVKGDGDNGRQHKQVLGRKARQRYPALLGEEYDKNTCSHRRHSVDEKRKERAQAEKAQRRQQKGKNDRRTGSRMFSGEESVIPACNLLGKSKVRVGGLQAVYEMPSGDDENENDLNSQDRGHTQCHGEPCSSGYEIMLCCNIPETMFASLPTTGLVADDKIVHETPSTQIALIKIPQIITNASRLFLSLRANNIGSSSSSRRCASMSIRANQYMRIGQINQR